MSLYYYSLLAVFAVIIYMMVVDKNVAAFLLLIFRLFKLNIERWQWLIINHPDNFFTTWWRMEGVQKVRQRFSDQFTNGP